MARITVEDCLKNINNRFVLVMVAAKRARQIEMENEHPLVNSNDDKATVIALREIATRKINADILEDSEEYIQTTHVELIQTTVSSGETGEAV